MSVTPAGTEIDYTITYLEMTSRPGYDRPSLPAGPPTALIAAQQPPVWYFLNLYDAVGRDYEWDDWHRASDEERRAFVQDPEVRLFTLLRTGWPAGFFMLDTRHQGVCDLAYFGLVPEAVGHGLGRYLLQTAIHAGWDLPGVERMSVNTCTLDHPAALGLYQRCGFVPYERETKTCILMRDRVTPES
ncbi:GNAT family N-acetyltransferase [Algicella marina]|uniref:GNAT family N-acetyltransferase n=1 Tax=Algicella marina TaxID=2683284 RepID=A0A6P1T4R7_9RHOB|nr:GNAT family N-acetyltransferase [Algicella marina]QHQ36710.1 GNAT family N-acetyltransferase [Algicella marina]